MEKKSNGLVVLVIILVLIVLGLCGYIVYDKVMNKEDNTTVEKEDTESKEDSIDISEINSIVSEKFKIVFDYEYYPPYCGERSDEYTTDVGDWVNGYYASKNLTSYEEMISYLKENMSEELIESSKFPSTNKDYYAEKDGKLYCASLGVGGSYTYLDSTVELEEVADNEIKAKILVKVEYPASDEYTYVNYNVSFEKIDNNYIITSYEKVEE